MKTRSILFSLLLASVAFSFFTGCSGPNKEAAKSEEAADMEMKDMPATDSTAPTKAGKPQFQVDAKFQAQLASVFSSYVSLKDALVESDAAKAKIEATTTSQSLAKADMKLLSGAAHNDWMTYMDGIGSSLNKIATSSDIEVQREAFSILSDNLYKSIKAYGLGGTTAYYDFCPMAFNNQGAYWLSAEEKIRNPYFGDRMLTCGSVKETVQ